MTRPTESIADRRRHSRMLYERQRPISREVVSEASLCSVSRRLIVLSGFAASPNVALIYAS